jgi:hypothetical protein
MNRTLAALSLALALLSTALIARPAGARCARVTVPREASRSTYVFEGTYLGAADQGGYRFRVTADWKGHAPREVVVHRGGRGVLATEQDVGTTYLVFATQRDENDPRLNASRCGSSGRLAQSSSTVEALRGLGLTRSAR